MTDEELFNLPTKKFNQYMNKNFGTKFRMEKKKCDQKKTLKKVKPE